MQRCNYCRREARTVIAWTSSVPCRGSRRALTIRAAACPDHEGCVNFVDTKRLHPEATVSVNPLVR